MDTLYLSKARDEATIIIVNFFCLKLKISISTEISPFMDASLIISLNTELQYARGEVFIRKMHEIIFLKSTNPKKKEQYSNFDLTIY